MMETVVRVLTLCGWWEEQVTLYSDHLSYSRVRLFVTQWAITLQAPLSLEFSRQEYGSGLPCPLPGDLPNRGIKSTFLRSPALAGAFLTTSDTWEALKWAFFCLLLWADIKVIADV